MQPLPAEQQKEATLSQDKGRNNIVAEAFSDNKSVNCQGLPTAQMTNEQKEKLWHLANQSISNKEDRHAKVKMTDIKDHLNSPSQ